MNFGKHAMKRMMSTATLLAAAVLALPVQAADVPAAAGKAEDAQQPDSTVVASRERAAEAQKAFTDFLRAYERGDIATLQRQLDPSMIGYGQFLDGLQADAARQQQTRITLRDLQVMAGPDVAVIQTRWQKRFLVVSTFQPALQEGAGMFMLHRGTDGWRLAAIAGDTPFAGGGGVLAQVVFPAGAPLCPPLAACTTTVEVRDPDQVGSATLSAVVTTSAGDREVLALTPTSPGRFQATFNLVASTPSPGNTLVEAAAGSTITVTYTDATAGPGRPATPVSAKVRLP